MIEYTIDQDNHHFVNFECDKCRELTRVAVKSYPYTMFELTKMAEEHYYQIYSDNDLNVKESNGHIIVTGPVCVECDRCFNEGSDCPCENPVNDNVHHPNHYISSDGTEVKDVIKSFTENMNGYESYCQGNIIKYILRWKKKNGIEDLEKAKQYIDFLIYFLKEN